MTTDVPPVPPFIINKPIKGFGILKPGTVQFQETPPLKVSFESLKREEELDGTTYKLEPVGSDHALYVTINNKLFEGKLYPYEIFLNSANMEHFQWVCALTRTISAVWRKGGNADFLAAELIVIQQPGGGYFKKGNYVESIVADIGYTIEKHMKKLEIRNAT